MLWMLDVLVYAKASRDFFGFSLHGIGLTGFQSDGDWGQTSAGAVASGINQGHIRVYD